MIYTKYQARKKVEVALRNNAIVKMPCQDCGLEKVEAHHEDYQKPLEVTWLCRKCHTNLHKLRGTWKENWNGGRKRKNPGVSKALKSFYLSQKAIRET